MSVGDYTPRCTQCSMPLYYYGGNYGGGWYCTNQHCHLNQYHYHYHYDDQNLRVKIAELEEEIKKLKQRVFVVEREQSYYNDPFDPSPKKIDE